jgi:predicted dienelactone hydrolase
MGPYVVQATRDCAVAGQSLPLIVISHGQGGTRLGHHDTATALADAGFVVASFNHPGDSFGDDASTNDIGTFEARPAQVSRVITHMVSQWKHRDVIDAQSIGVFGFSRGGYTALALAGAVPSATASASRLCGFWRSLVIPMCRQIDRSGAQLKARADPRVKAVVAADPLNLFDASSFAAVTAPVQLWASELGGAGVELAHVESIRTSLPRTPEFAVAKGAGHFAFLAPCPDEISKEARALCEDPKGFDRPRWHATMNRAVSAFFTRTLRTGAK